MMATAFYERAQPLVEQLVTLARDWRDRAPADPEAIQLHSRCFWLAVYLDLQLNRCRQHSPRVVMAAQSGGKP